MPYKIESNIEKDYIDITYTGIVTPDEVMEVESKVIVLVNKDRPTMFLTDMLNAELTFSIVNLFGKPDDWNAMGFNRANRLAIVAQRDGKHWENLQFFETTCINQGWQVILLSNRAEAIEWLSK